MRPYPTRTKSRSSALSRSLQSAVPQASVSSGAPAQLAAYALGATLWTPALLLVAGPFERVLAWLVPGLPMAGIAATFALVWALRFMLYAIGAARGWDYGYGINGVIVNRRLTLADKGRRIARDWFGMVLGVIWLAVMLSMLLMMMAAP